MPTKSTISVLCLGDIVGKPGRQVLDEQLNQIQNEFSVDFTVANIENAVTGFGFNKKIYHEMLDLNINAFTSGNHVYAKRDVMDQFDEFDKLVRPLNFPSQHPGTGVRIFEFEGIKIAVINLIGRVFMQLSDCPFNAINHALNSITADIIIVDFHAEATSEKQAMGWYLNKKVTLMLGTHTHVQTADCRLLSKRTAYVTDIGMCGAYDSVLGMDKDISINKFIDQLPSRHKPVVNPQQFVLGGIVINVNIDNNTINSADMIHRVYNNEKN